MTTTADHVLPDTASGVLAFAREQRAAADRAGRRLLEAAVQWAVIHPAESIDDAEGYRLRSGGEVPVGLAGPGAPHVAVFSVAEFAAAVGMGTEAGKHYLGHALELRHRLPRLWAQVMSGDLAAWRAHRVADATICRGLSPEAAEFVDAHVAPVAHKVWPGQLDRLVTEAVGRFMPERTVPSRRPVRRTVLHLHLSTAAVTGGAGVGRCENTRSPVTAEQISRWCGHPDTHLTVKPVIDLADHVSVDAHEVPDRITERVALRDHSCVFPWCTRPARTLRPDGHGCDTDHVTPYDDTGPPGQTCPCRLAPLCRTHHRLKTHGRWTYTILEPGSYLWRSPHGYTWLRDHNGTVDLSPD